MISPELTIYFSIIRLAPDPVREEFANVGIAAVSEAGPEIRMLPSVPPHLRAIAPPGVLRAVPDVEAVLRRLLADARSVDGLEAIAREGLNGFLLTTPRRRVIDQRRVTLAQVVEGLYREYVAPHRWRHERVLHRATPLERTIRLAIMSRFPDARDRYALGLTIRSAHLALRFPLAFANGRATIVQAVDLSATARTQETHTEEAIGKIAEVNAILGERAVFGQGPAWVSVLRDGGAADGYGSRLKRFSDVISDRQIDDLTDAIGSGGGRPIEQAFADLGFRATRNQMGVEVDVAAAS